MIEVDEQRIRLLRTDQVARLLGISCRTVCLWAECSELPALKVGRQWRFRESEIQNWLEERERLSRPMTLR